MQGRVMRSAVGKEPSHRLCFQRSRPPFSDSYLGERVEIAYGENRNERRSIPNPKGRKVSQQESESDFDKNMTRYFELFALYLQDECQNYIRVIAKKDDRQIYVCGTNAFNPKCRTFENPEVSEVW